MPVGGEAVAAAGEFDGAVGSVGVDDVARAVQGEYLDQLGMHDRAVEALEIVLDR